MYTTPSNIAFNTDSTGTYNFLTSAVGDQLMPALPTQFSSSNPPFYLTNGNAANVDFGLHFDHNIQDLTVDLTNRNPFRPGFNTIMDAKIENMGTVLVPSQLKILLDPTMIYVNSSITPLIQTADSLVFNTDTLNPFQSQTISIEILTDALTPISTLVKSTAIILPIVGDTVPANNISTINTEVVGSFDPNDKSASSDPYFTPAQLQNGDEMQYVVRFQNTGTYLADFVRISDTLDNFIDVSSFRVISSSHEMYYNFSVGNVVTFYFDDIDLPPSITDEPNSHGFVKFGVRFFSGLPIGTGIENTANIYFDFNPPITTNTVSTLIADPPLNVSISEIESELSVLVFPNPVNNILHGIIDIAKSSDNFTIQLVDLSGKTLYENQFVGAEFSVDISSFDNAIYIGRITSLNYKTQTYFRFIVLK